VTAPTLTEFLLARIAEDEVEAEDNEPYWGGWSRAHEARVLAECEAKRRIIETASMIDMIENEWGASILRTLAAVYSDHPDYRQEWKQ